MQIILLLSAFTITSVLLIFLIRYADFIGIIDIPNERSAHTKITPRSGGIAIFSGFILTHLLLNTDHLIRYYYVYGAISIVFLIGFLDDKFDISPRLKFIFIFIASIILYIYDVQITSVGTYFGHEFILPAWMVFPFTFFAIAGFTNALNLMDGLDGLAGAIALVILSAFLAIGMIHNDPLMSTISMTLIASIGAFLLFNWNPAKIFMGDSGSLTIGFSIAVLSILSLKYISPTAVLFIIALPLLDTFIVIVRRLRRGISPASADKTHIHHFMYNFKKDVRFVVVLLASIQCTFTLIGYQLRNADDFLSLLLFFLLFAIFFELFDQRIRRR